jgi:hypothetical protein
MGRRQQRRYLFEASMELITSPPADFEDVATPTALT